MMDTPHVNSKEENFSEIDPYVDDQTRPVHNNFKRRKLQTTNIESLPSDVVLDILARVPDHEIYNAAWLVRSKCYHDFVHAHLEKSTYGLLIQRINGFDQTNKQLLFATQKGRIIQKSKFINYKFTGDAFSSCNGLVLERHYKKPKFEFRITNPATKQHLDLPSFGLDTAFYNSAIAYAVASKEYKVVRSFYSLSGEVECAIFTVGVDVDWKRRVDIQHLSPTAKKLLGKFPSSTQGFVHWAHNGSSRNSEYVLTLNIETEIITQFQAVPPASLLCGCDGDTKLFYRYLPMGSYLSLLIARDNEFPILDEVWEMEPETGEWTKMMSINSESQKRAFEGVVLAKKHMLRPVGWLKFREVLVFTASNPSSGFCIAYNVRTHEIESSFKLDFSPHRFVVHRNSMVWLE